MSAVKLTLWEQCALELFEQIKQAASNDDEKAHMFEDELAQFVLEGIVLGECPNPKKYAELSLSTREIYFSRWYA